MHSAVDEGTSKFDPFLAYFYFLLTYFLQSTYMKISKLNNVQRRLIDSNLLETSGPVVADELVASDIYTLYGLDYDSPKFRSVIL